MYFPFALLIIRIKIYKNYTHLRVQCNKLLDSTLYPAVCYCIIKLALCFYVYCTIKVFIFEY